MHRITDNIWIGNSADARELSAPIDAVLNCAFDLANAHQWDRLHVAHCGLIDGPGNPLSAYYSAVFQLHNLIHHGKTVLVHCHAGESRSVAVAIMYFNARDHLGWDHWRNFIRKVRHTPPWTPHVAHHEAFDKMDWEFLKSILRGE